MNKISGILSDEESMRQLNELAKMFRENGTDSRTPENTESVKSDSADSSMPDMEQMMQLMNLAGTFSQQDRNTELLLALRPHLREEKQQKLDHAVKLLKLISVYNAAKESGLINNIL